MPQCTPVVLHRVIALLSFKKFKAEVEKDSLFAGIAYGQPFVPPFGIIIFISSRSLNHKLLQSISV